VYSGSSNLLMGTEGDKMNNYFDESLIISVQDHMLSSIKGKLNSIIEDEVRSERTKLAAELLDVLEESRRYAVLNL
jgi:hypothetical protein